jgi:hypothetical protein
VVEIGRAHVANITAGTQRFDFAALKYGAGVVPNEVRIPLNQAVVKVGVAGGTVEHNGVLVAVKIAIVSNEPPSRHPKRLRL